MPALSQEQWRRVRIWFPAVGWAAIIFVFSGKTFSGEHTGSIVEPLLRHFLPALPSTVIDIIHVFMRKIGHLAEYFILAALVTRALRQEIADKLSLRHLAFALVLTSLYAVGDEWHQALVPGRSPRIMDVLIDVIGATGGTLWYHLRNRGKNPL